MKNSNNYNLKKEPKAGRVIGIVLLVLGSVLTGILFYLASTVQSLPRLLVAGPVILALGIGMLMFPGGNFTYKEIQSGKSGARRLWSEAPLLHKLAWVLTCVIGIVISFKIMISQEFLAPL